MKVQGADPTSHKLRRLNEQFHQFRAMTQTRLDLLALNQNRTSSKGLESHVQALNDHYHHMSQDLEHLRHSAAQEIEDLREWSRKLEKKNKRMERRLALMETKCLSFQKLKYDPCQDFFNFTVELQSQEERLSALQVQRDELLIGLQGLQESLKNQALHVTRLEGQISEVLQWNGRWKVRGSGMTRVSSNMTPQKSGEHRGRNHTHKGQRLWRRMDKPTQPRQESVNITQTDGHLPAKPDPPQTESHPPWGFSWDEREDDELDTKAESSEIHKVLQLPETQDPDAASS
ncbi:uncharacterized protein FYW49_015375 [Xenentodon cancila]